MCDFWVYLGLFAVPQQRLAGSCDYSLPQNHMGVWAALLLSERKDLF